LFRWSLSASLLLAACSRPEAGEQGASSPPPAPAAQKLAAVTVPAAPSLTAVDPGLDGLAAFEQALARKFDRSQMTARPLAGGGILHVPNGHPAHAAIVIRNPDGTLKRGCVSSPAEVSALLQKVRDGAGQ
jgi:hypothetical protein